MIMISLCGKARTLDYGSDFASIWILCGLLCICPMQWISGIVGCLAVLCSMLSLYQNLCCQHSVMKKVIEDTYSHEHRLEMINCIEC